MRDPLEGLTDDGTIRTGVSLDRIPPAFSPILADLVREFEDHREPSWELQLYGSVATGVARVGLSDVDLVLINGSPTWADEASARLSFRHAQLCRGVEIGVAQTSDYVGDSDLAYGNRVFLRHYCVSLAGPDAVRARRPFPGDRRAARGFNGDIAAELARWRSGDATARRISRKTLLAASGIVSIRTGTWTTDRATAAQWWIAHQPAHGNGIELLSRHADRTDELPVDELHELLAPDGVVSAVADSFASEIGIWSSPSNSDSNDV